MESATTSRRPSKTRLRNREAQEPEEFANRPKACQRCGGTDVKFKYLNNKKQPRYECRTCRNNNPNGGPSLFNPFPMRPLHRKGYLKVPVLEPKEFKVQTKYCPRCNSSTHVRFLDLNNKSPKQPRYRCRECRINFSPFKTRGRVPAKATSESVEAVNCSTELIDATAEELQLLAPYEISQNLIPGMQSSQEPGSESMQPEFPASLVVVVADSDPDLGTAEDAEMGALLAINTGPIAMETWPPDCPWRLPDDLGSIAPEGASVSASETATSGVDSHWVEFNVCF